MKELKLTKGQVALVDDDTYEWASQYNWHAKKMNGNFYAARSEYLPEAYRAGLPSHTKTVLLNREILQAAKGEDVDHENKNTLDNRKDNLRLCNRPQNMWNQKIRSSNTSGFKGVNLKRGNTIKIWNARLSYNNKRIHIGYYTTAEEAARAYDQKAKEFFGEFAQLNFPQVVER